MGQPGSAFDDDDRDQLRKLHAEGKSRNEIMREMRRSGRTISHHAAAMGLSFERGPQVAAATEACRADAKNRRAALALNLLSDAERLRKSLWETCTAYNFGGKDNTFNQVLLDQPSFRDKRDIILAAKSAMEASLRLDEYDAGDSGQIGSLLGDLFKAMQTKHGTGEPEPAPTDG